LLRFSFLKNANIQGEEMCFHEAIFYITGEMGVISEKMMMFERRRILMKQEKGKKSQGMANTTSLILFRDMMSKVMENI